MSKIGQVSLLLIFAALLLAACPRAGEQVPSRPTAADLASERLTQVPLIGGTPPPFPPPPPSVEGEDAETSLSPPPPTTTGASPTPINPGAADAQSAETEAAETEAAEREAEQAEPAQTGPQGGEPGEDSGEERESIPGENRAGGVAPVQVEVVFVTPAPEGFVADTPSVPIQVSVVVLGAPEEEGDGSAPSEADAPDEREVDAEGEEPDEAFPPEESQAAATPEAALREDVQAYLAAGAHVYSQRCAACHGPNGFGRREYFPDLQGNRILTVEDPDGIIGTVLHGRNLMPPFRNLLSDAEIAAAISFLRYSWGDGAGFVMPDDVATVRQEQ